MPLITLAEVKQYLNVDQADDAFDAKVERLIPIITNRLRYICNNSFTVHPLHKEPWFSQQSYPSDDTLYLMSQVSATFDASSATVTARGYNFASAMFASGQDFLVYGSYLNDGYFTVESVSTSTLTVASTGAFVNEATGATIWFCVARWPEGIKPLVASLIQYDYQERGMWRDSTDTQPARGEYGYPADILAPLESYKIPKFGSYL